MQRSNAPPTPSATGSSSLQPARRAHSRANTSVRDSQEQQELRGWWESAISQNMDLSYGYVNVAVLLIKWDDQIDDTNSAGEVDELRRILEESYHYNVCETLQLSVRLGRSKPQHQLNKSISTFIEAYDKPRTLLIVYYTGHGIWSPQTPDRKGSLWLSASQNTSTEPGHGHNAVAEWNVAEEPLRQQHVDADVFVILDCCFASNLAHKGICDEPNARSFQLLAATGPDQTTSSAKECTFTYALNIALKDLREECKSFTPHMLSERINRQTIRRSEQSSVWNRLDVTGQPIQIAPLDQGMRSKAFREPVKGHLTLRFNLKHKTLDKGLLDSLTRDLSKCFGQSSMVRGIDWVCFREVQPLHAPDAIRRLFLAWRYWRKWRSPRRTDVEGCVAQVVQSSMLESRSYSQAPTAKRKRSVSPAPPKVAKARYTSFESPTLTEDEETGELLTPRTMTPLRQ